MSAWGKANGIKGDDIVSDWDWLPSYAITDERCRTKKPRLTAKSIAIPVGPERKVFEEHWLGAG